jgi:hypothetical protein
MTAIDWLRRTVQVAREESVRTAALTSGFELTTGVLRRLHWRRPLYGVPVMERDWDVLVVLDGCRRDALQAVADEYDWLPDFVPTVTSRGSHSREWLHTNFRPAYAEEMAATAHLTWNTFTEYELDADDWHSLEELWRDCWDREQGCVPPRAVTDRAIQRWRRDDPDRLLLHYMQPHAPFRSLGITATENAREAATVNVWDHMEDGRLSMDEGWAAYLDNLRWVLENVALLRENIDADRVVVTADHGECFGEFGYWEHPMGVPLPALVRVPWATTDATDEGTHEPDEWGETDDDPVDVEARLSALGYRE